jgi:methylmalonyl-CoA mutase
MTHSVSRPDGKERHAYTQEWRALVSSVLRRQGLGEEIDPEQALTTTSPEGIELRPLYTGQDTTGEFVGDPGQFPFVRGNSAHRNATWDVRAHHRHPVAAITNRAILADLAGGATSIWLELGPTGLAVADLEPALRGVQLDGAAIALDAGTDTSTAVRSLFELAARTGVDPAQLRGTLGADPLGAHARYGAPSNLHDLSVLVSLAKKARGTAMTTATIDGTVYNDAGGTDADELAISAAIGVAYIRALADAGVDDPFDQVEFRVAVGDDQFASIAKLRAARHIWARIAELCGATAAARQHAVTAAPMMTIRSPWTNVVRTTIACAAAAIGGADIITVRPFDDAIGLADGLARRIARNTQAVIQDEAQLGRVADPAGGSWYVESRTAALADIAWDLFTAIERKGGAARAFDSGMVGDLLARSRARREQNINTRRVLITGVTSFPDLDEVALAREAGTTSSDQVGPAGSLPKTRYAEEFEEVRARMDVLARSGATSVYPCLVTVGSAAGYRARVREARDVFALIGLAVDVLHDLPPDHASVPPVVCVCGSDDDYREEADALVTRLRAGGARRVLIVGPSENLHGSDEAVRAGSDVLAELRSVVATLEAAT